MGEEYRIVEHHKYLGTRLEKKTGLGLFCSVLLIQPL